MNNKTRLKRLRMLEDMLKRHKEIFPEVKFNMGVWGEKLEKKTRGCGTAACALGSASLYPPFRKMGLRGAWVHGDLVINDGDEPCSGWDENIDAGERFFGIDYWEARKIFIDPSDRREVIAAVRKLIKECEAA